MFKRESDPSCKSNHALSVAESGSSREPCCLFESLEARVLLSADPYQFGQVAISGGGYFTSVIFHEAQPDLLWSTSDVTGPWKRTDESEPWRSALWGDFESDERPRNGSAGLALHPTDVNIVYAEFGNGEAEMGLYKSVDAGESWDRVLEKFSSSNPIGDKSRKFGPPVAVDPNNGDVVYWGTRQDGIWRSTNAGADFTNVRPKAGGENNVGTRSVMIDRGVIENGRSKYIYASVDGVGVFHSTNSGNSFSQMTAFNSLPGLPTDVWWMDIADDGTLVVAHEQGLAKYTRSGGWTDITVTSGVKHLGVTIDPHDSSRILTQRGELMFKSTNGGSSWTEIDGDTSDVVIDYKTPWQFRDFFKPANGGVGIFLDPHFEGRAYATDSFNFWRTDDIWATTTHWTTDTLGAENVVTLTLASGPTSTSGNAGRLYSGVSDNRGFRHVDPHVVPDDYLHRGSNGNNYITGIAIHEANPDIMMIAKHKNDSPGEVLRSTDGGLSWTLKTAPTSNNFGGAKIALSATDPNNAVIALGNYQNLRYTTNGGTSWQVAEFPSGSAVGSISDDATAYNYDQLLTADTVDGGAFYLFDAVGTERMLYSRDGGATWNVSSTSITRNGTDHSATVTVVARPGVAGEVWMSNGHEIYKSTNYGQSFSQVTYFQSEAITAIAFGAPKPGTSIATLYVRGTRASDSVRGLWRSLDNGSTWERIDNDSFDLPDRVRFMQGDRQVYGTVYFHTEGHGIGYAQINDDAPTVTGLASTLMLDGTSASDAFDLADTESAADVLWVDVVGNTNPSLLDQIDLQRIDADTRQLVVTPAAGQSGTTTLTLAIHDGPGIEGDNTTTRTVTVIVPPESYTGDLVEFDFEEGGAGTTSPEMAALGLIVSDMTTNGVQSFQDDGNGGKAIQIKNADPQLFTFTIDVPTGKVLNLDAWSIRARADKPDHAVTVTVNSQTIGSFTPGEDVWTSHSGTASVSGLTGTVTVQVSVDPPQSFRYTRIDDLVLTGSFSNPINYSEDFEDDSADGLTPVSGSWSINQWDRYVGENSNDWAISRIDPGVPLPGNFEFQYVTRTKDIGVSENSFMIFDYVDANNFKYAAMLDGSDKWIIGETVSGTRTTLASLSETIDTNTDYTMTLRITGSTASLLVGGVSKVSHNFDEPLNDGGLAIGAYQAQTVFDNISIIPL